jgi:hypothetical protein
VIDERLEGVRDLAGVAKVVVEDRWYERHRRRAVPAEDTRVGEILSLVDDDRVEAVAGLELCARSAI